MKKILLTRDEEPIIALCTPRGSGAIAVIRISGSRASGSRTIGSGVSKIVDKISKLSSGKKLQELSSHTIHHGHIVNPTSSEIVDEVLFFLMNGPKTFTGQDTIEISCHNNHFIIEEIITHAISCGARLAKPGEFTKRAFLNKKVDLVQAEAIHDVITAQTELALRKSMAQLHGSFSEYISKIEQSLLEILTFAEASFEFLDEEQRDLDFDKNVKNKFVSLQKKLVIAKQNFNQQQRIKEGVRFAIIGSVNVGKSTLFNALLKKNRAIVTDIAGTTRDSIEASLYKDGNFWLLIDTAGLRQTGDVIEKEGIERSLREAEQADIILLVCDPQTIEFDQQMHLYKDIFEKYQKKVIVVLNKIDESSDKKAERIIKDSFKDTVILVSAKNKTGIEEVEKQIQDKIQEIFKQLRSPFLLNQRQFHLVSELEIKMKAVEKESSSTVHYELVAHHVRDMLEHLSELTGKDVSEQVLDNVFSKFCIGK